MIIRAANDGDLSKIQELNQLLFQKEVVDYDATLNSGWTLSAEGEKYYQKKISEDNSCAFVAEDSGEVVGYLVGGICSCYSYRQVGKMAELENMLVLEEYRSQGIGGQLMEEFLHWCLDHKVERVKVVAAAGNNLAHNFYRKHGFKDYDLCLERDLSGAEDEKH